MPRLGRFLWGGWLVAQQVEFCSQSANGSTASAGYRDYKNAQHHRHIILDANGLIVRDSIKGFQKNAVLRWRLCPGKWHLEKNSVSLEGFTLIVSADMPVIRFELVDGWESLHYMEKGSLPVLEVEFERAGEITTKLL